jgi:outer membrane protein TolC
LTAVQRTKADTKQKLATIFLAANLLLSCSILPSLAKPSELNLEAESPETAVPNSSMSPAPTGTSAAGPSTDVGVQPAKDGQTNPPANLKPGLPKTPPAASSIPEPSSIPQKSSGGMAAPAATTPGVTPGASETHANTSGGSSTSGSLPTSSSSPTPSAPFSAAPSSSSPFSPFSTPSTSPFSSSPILRSAAGAASGASSITPQVASPADSSTALQPIQLPEYAPRITHTEAKTLNLYPLYLSKAIEMHSFDALRNETSVTQEISLRDAINYVLDQGMQIKVSRESMNYQHILTLSGMANFLPTYTTSFNLGYANVINQYTTSISRTFLTGVSFPVFQGGAVLYSLLAQRYREKAWREAYRATVSDVFLDVYQKYTNLILQRVLCQTLGKAVEADEEQLEYSKARFKHDVGTRYEIMQVEALLSSDKQAFLQQAVTMRQAGLALNLALNYPLSINLVPVEQTLTEAPLIDSRVQLKTLLQDTLNFNSGLRQYEYFRLAASRNIQVQSASLYPAVNLFALYQINDATVSPAANGAALGGAATTAIDSFLDTSFVGRVSNNALGQQYTFSPTAGSTSTQGANTAPAAMPASSGGTPIAQIQSGSLVSSGAVAPSIFGGGTGSGSGSNQNGSLQAPAGIFPGVFRESQIGFSLSWSLPSFGLTAAASIAAARVLARQALMQCNQEISIVTQQVRGDYLAYLSAREAIDRAAYSTAATKESLTDAKARLAQGVSTQLDLIRSQHDYIAALTAQAQAIVASNVAQAQMLHDMGMISASTLTDGYKPGTFNQQRPTGYKRWF